jgi:hypothetical protein
MRSSSRAIRMRAAPSPFGTRSRQRW